MWYSGVKSKTDEWRQRTMFDTRRDVQEQVRRLMNRLAMAGLVTTFLVVALVAMLGAS